MSFPAPYRFRDRHAVESVPASSGRRVARPTRSRFDWVALAFWLGYFSLYSTVGWTMLRVGECVERWCR